MEGARRDPQKGRNDVEKGRRKAGEGKMLRKRKKNEMMNENEDIDQRRNDTRHCRHVNVGEHTNIRRHRLRLNYVTAPSKSRTVTPQRATEAKVLVETLKTF